MKTRLQRIGVDIPLELKRRYEEACESSYVKPISNLRKLIADFVILSEANPRGFPKPRKNGANDDHDFGETARDGDSAGTGSTDA